MKLKFLALVALTTALTACDGSSPKGIVGVAYEALQRGNYPLFVSAFTPEAKAVYATPELFQQYQEMLRTYSGSFSVASQQTIERHEQFERKRLVVKAHAYMSEGSDENVFHGADHGDDPVGNPPQIFPGANAHLYPEVIPMGPMMTTVEVLVFETDCVTYPNSRRACAISAVRLPNL